MEEDSWLPNDISQQFTDDADMATIGKFKIAYQAGKGKKCLLSDLIRNSRQLLYLLWTACKYTRMSDADVNINYFLALLEHPVAISCIDVDS